MSPPTCRLLVEGMHCPSCVRHIEELLSEHGLRSIVVSLFAGTVSFEHDPDFDLKRVLVELKDSGYRPVLPEKQHGAGEHPNRSTPMPRSRWLDRLRPARRQQRRRHRAVCEACRLEEEQDSAKPEVLPVHPVVTSTQTKSVFSIEGMTCGSCVGALKAGLKEDGIDRVSVTLLPGRAEVVHDTSKISVEAVIGLIEELGYGAYLDSSDALLDGAQPPAEDDGRWRIRLSVQGMTCASCTGSVRSTIAAVLGTADIEVDLMNGLATFTAASEADAATIREEIADVGFDCEVVDTRKVGDGQKPEVTSQADVRNIRFRVDGMFCGECVVKVNNALDAISQDHHDFVFSPVSLRSPFVAVSYRPDLPAFSARTLRECIASLGFECVPAPLDSIEKRAAAARDRDRKAILVRFLVALVFAIPTFVIAIVGMSVLSDRHPFRRYWETPVWGMASRGELAMWALATPVQFGVGSVFYVRSWKSLRAVWRRRRGKVSWRARWLPRLFRWGSMDTLVALGTSLAYVSSVVFLVLDVTAGDDEMSGEMGYFDTSIFLIFFILGGRYLEALSKRHTGDAISELNKTKSTKGLLVHTAEATSSSQTEEVDAAFIEVGDVLLVPAGSSPPLDGILLGESATTSFDESALTGESRPVLKQAGDTVYAGTINTGPSAARLRVTSVLGTSMVDSIANAVRDAMSKKAGIERVADTITAFFVPAIVAIACFTLAIWLLRGYVGDLPSEWLDGQRQGGWALFALQFSIAVLVVACPCGIGLAAPTAQLIGVGLAAKHGILPNGGGEAFQAYSNVDAVVLDKTGTLTTSEFQVSDAELLVEGDTERALLWRMAAAIEAASSHPLSVGLRTRCEAELDKTTTPRVELVSSEEVAGRGLAAVVTVGEEGERYEVCIGNEALMRDRGASYAVNATRERCEADIRRWQAEAKSVILLAVRSLGSSSHLGAISSYRILALFGLHDPPRPEAFAVVSELTRRRITVYMCTGDNEATARAVARTVGVDPDRVVSHALPDDKRALVQRLQAGEGLSIKKRRAVVAFCGDGINDSPALAQADAGIAMGSGSAVALKAAHFTLLTASHPLLGLVTLHDLSRATLRKIYSNFGWASLYNTLLIPLAAGAFYGLGRTRLPPVWASLAMALSSVSVVLNSLLLRAMFRLPRMVREYRDRL